MKFIQSIVKDQGPKLVTVQGLPKTLADRGAQEAQNNIEERAAFVKAVVSFGEQIITLKTQRLIPRE